MPGHEKASKRSSAAGRKVLKKHRNGVRLADFWSKPYVLRKNVFIWFALMKMMFSGNEEPCP